MLLVSSIARFVPRDIYFYAFLLRNVVPDIQVMKPQSSCPLQYLNILIRSYSDVGSEAVQNTSSVDFVGNSIMESVAGLPAQEDCYSSFMLIGWNGLAFNTTSTNFSK